MGAYYLLVTGTDRHGSRVSISTEKEERAEDILNSLIKGTLWRAKRPSSMTERLARHHNPYRGRKILRRKGWSQ